MPDEESVAIWVDDLSPEELAAMREWAEPKYDIHREYEDTATLLDEAVTGDFSFVIVKAIASLPPDVVKRLNETEVKLLVWPRPKPAKGERK
jgi:hypothetical protein